MKKIILSIALMSLFGCSNTTEDGAYKPVIKLKSVNSLGAFPYNRNRDELTEVIIDSCEYIVANSYDNREPLMTHKGNCKNCRNFLIKLINQK